ncbi:hypothetical protein BJF89_17025 [Corynebacterium sp. CNJ-954]|nr:hypothetical protein BJF89_17025 [Corynebacterium sp. CNJ-954]
MNTMLAAVLISATAWAVNPTPPAQADVFHGYWIKGRIEQTFHRLGGHAKFGNATTNESNAARGGKFQVFAKSSSIYWHPNVSGGVARQVGGRIRDKWRDLGWENSRLKYPTTDEIIPPDGKGRFNHFEGGSIYWSPATDAHQIEGLIFDKWAELGHETGVLGYPTTDEATPPDRTGRFNHFEGGSIYFHPTYGTHQVTGKIRELWKDNGWETGKLGYPTSDPYQAGGGIKQDFVGGAIQSFEPTGVALARYDQARYSSYRQTIPLFTTAAQPRWAPEAMNRELIQHMDDYFPLTGCPDELTTGASCTLTGIGGRSGTATVERIADSGITLTTNPGHPEGAGRKLNIRFDTVTAPTGITAADGQMLFDDTVNEAAYLNSDKTWIRLVVEAFGDTSSTQVAGPFVSDHIGAQVWPELATNLRDGATSAKTTYTPL